MVLGALRRPEDIQNLDLSFIATANLEQFRAKDKYVYAVTERNVIKRFFKKKSHLSPFRRLRAVAVTVGAVTSFVDCKAVRLALDNIPSPDPAQLMVMTQAELDGIDPGLSTVVLWVMGLDHGHLLSLDNFISEKLHEREVAAAQAAALANPGNPPPPVRNTAQMLVLPSGLRVSVFNVRVPTAKIQLAVRVQSQHTDPRQRLYAGFHGSYYGNFDSILRSGLRVGNARRGAQLGRAIYAARDLSHALNVYADEDNQFGVPYLKETWRSGNFNAKTVFNAHPRAAAMIGFEYARARGAQFTSLNRKTFS